MVEPIKMMMARKSYTALELTHTRDLLYRVKQLTRLTGTGTGRAGGAAERPTAEPASDVTLVTLRSFTPGKRCKVFPASVYRLNTAQNTQTHGMLEYSLLTGLNSIYNSKFCFHYSSHTSFSIQNKLTSYSYFFLPDTQ